MQAIPWLSKTRCSRLGCLDEVRKFKTKAKRHVPFGRQFANQYHGAHHESSLIVDTTVCMKAHNGLLLYWLIASQRMSKLCVKCRISGAFENDTWCLGCSAWESLGKELVNSWGGPAGVRAVADDIVLNAVREVRALRALSAGLGRASASARGSALPAGEDKSEPARGSSHAGLSAKAKASKEKEKSHDSDYTYDYETETEGEEKPKEGTAVDKRPAQEAPQEKKKEKSAKQTEVKKETAEDQETGKKRSREKGEREEAQKDKRSERRREEEPPLQYKSDKKEKKKKNKKTRRGGRKHKRLERLAEDPYIPVHRGLSGRFLDEKPRREHRDRSRRQ
eukprot:s1144_g3.t1